VVGGRWSVVGGRWSVVSGENMDETFENEYVIKVESQSHGNTSYKVVSTLGGFERLLAELQPQVENIKRLSEKDPQYLVPRKLLWSKYATVAPGRTSRIYLSFELDTNLAEYHRRTLLQRAPLEYLFLAIIAGVLILAGIGVYAIVRFLS
jgi:hypothetical protein